MATVSPAPFAAVYVSGFTFVAAVYVSGFTIAAPVVASCVKMIANDSYVTDCSTNQTSRLARTVITSGIV